LSPIYLVEFIKGDVKFEDRFYYGYYDYCYYCPFINAPDIVVLIYWLYGLDYPDPDPGIMFPFSMLIG